MKTTRPVRNWACKGGWLFAVGYVIVILTAISMGKMSIATAQTESESPGSVLFDKTTDVVESYTDIPIDPSKIDSPSYISYTFSTEQVVPKKQDNEIIELREPNMEVFDLPDGKRQYKFYPSDQYVMKNDGNWYQLEYATTTIEKFYNEVYFEKPVTKWIIRSANAQTYSGAGDGYVWAGNATWDTVRHGTTGTAEYTNTEMPSGAYLTGGVHYISRIFLPFDTSSIPDDECAATAVLTINCFYIGGTGDTTHAVQGSQAATNELVSADYDNLSFTSFGSVSAGSTGDKDITFNATGLAAIENDAFTKIAVTDADDLNDNASAGANYASYRSSEYTGTGDDPYLTITTEDCSTSTPPAEASSTPFSVEGLNYSWDLTIIAGLTEHYESTTTAPDWVEVSYYHIPFIAWLILFVLLVFIFSRIIIELIIRWRTK